MLGRRASVLPLPGGAARPSSEPGVYASQDQPCCRDILWCHGWHGGGDLSLASKRLRVNAGAFSVGRVCPCGVGFAPGRRLCGVVVIAVVFLGCPGWRLGCAVVGGWG